MSESKKANPEEWKTRFEAVGRAQARYLFVLLLTGTFYWALRVQVVADTSNSKSQELPLGGVSVSRDVVLASAPLVLGVMLLAALGTFDALRRASDKLGKLLQTDESFERHDVHPTAIDFIVDCKSPLLKRAGLFSYPIFLSVLFWEAARIWQLLLSQNKDFPGRYGFLILGAVVLLWCALRLLKLWISKGKKAFARNPA